MISGSATGTPTVASRDLEADGIAAEVIFPNTIPPFFPVGTLVTQAAPATRTTTSCAGPDCRPTTGGSPTSPQADRDSPQGVAQIMLHDVDTSVEEIRWANTNGLTGGVLLRVRLPGTGLLPLHHEHYDPIWTVCEELGMPVNHHGGRRGSATAPSRKTS